LSEHSSSILGALFNVSQKKFVGVAFMRPQEMTQLVSHPYNAVIFKALDVIFESAVICGADVIYIWHELLEDGRYRFRFQHNGSDPDPMLLEDHSSALCQLRYEVSEYHGELTTERFHEEVFIDLTLPLFSTS
jgi:hypothetical protein